MVFMTKEELDKKDLVSQFSVVDGNLKFDENVSFSSVFNVGDIVTAKSDNSNIGIITFKDEDELNVMWTNDSETTENHSDLVIVPPTIGLLLLKDSNILDLWENLSNGKSEDFDLKCLYIGDLVINEVPFIKSFKNTNVIVDKKFKRDFTLFRKFGPSQIFRTNLYTIREGKPGLDKSRYVYYLLEGNIIYYLGIDLNEKDFGVYLYNR